MTTILKKIFNTDGEICELTVFAAIGLFLYAMFSAYSIFFCKTPFSFLEWPTGFATIIGIVGVGKRLRDGPSNQ